MPDSEAPQDPRPYEQPEVEELPTRDGTVETAGGAITGGDTF